MLWCVPGQVGGSEEYFVRQLLGLHEINAPFDVAVFAPRGFSVAHPDVAKSVLFMANQPLNVNIYHLMVMATDMPYAGRG